MWPRRAGKEKEKGVELLLVMFMVRGASGNGNKHKINLFACNKPHKNKTHEFASPRHPSTFCLPRQHLLLQASILTSCASLTPATPPSPSFTRSLSFSFAHSRVKKAKYEQQKQHLNVKIKKMISHTRCWRRRHSHHSPSQFSHHHHHHHHEHNDHCSGPRNEETRKKHSMEKGIDMNTGMEWWR